MVTGALMNPLLLLLLLVAMGTVAAVVSAGHLHQTEILGLGMSGHLGPPILVHILLLLLLLLIGLGVSRSLVSSQT